MLPKPPFLHITKYIICFQCQLFASISSLLINFLIIAGSFQTMVPCAGVVLLFVHRTAASIGSTSAAAAWPQAL